MGEKLLFSLPTFSLILYTFLKNVLPNVGMIVGTSFVPALKTCFKNNTFANFRFFDFASD